MTPSKAPSTDIRHVPRPFRPPVGGLVKDQCGQHIVVSVSLGFRVLSRRVSGQARRATSMPRETRRRHAEDQCDYGVTSLFLPRP